jgi:ABC-type Fe3+-hydroxamate transport system substrate-binding protein
MNAAMLGQNIDAKQLVLLQEEAFRRIAGEYGLTMEEAEPVFAAYEQQIAAISAKFQRAHHDVSMGMASRLNSLKKAKQRGKQ